MKDKEHVNLPSEDAADPIEAEKYCFLYLNDDGSIDIRSGVLRHGTTIDGYALCNSDPKHSAPNIDCNCGFYAFKRTNGLATPFDGNLSKALAEVELYGRIVVAEKGYRAQYQRILRLNFMPYCHRCGLQATCLTTVNTSSEEEATWSSYDRIPPSGFLQSSCDTDCCRHKGQPIRLTPSYVSNRIGTEVRWAVR